MGYGFGGGVGGFDVVVVDCVRGFVGFYWGFVGVVYVGDGFVFVCYYFDGYFYGYVGVFDVVVWDVYCIGVVVVVIVVGWFYVVWEYVCIGIGYYVGCFDYVFCCGGVSYIVLGCWFGSDLVVIVGYFGNWFGFVCSCIGLV